MFKLYSKACEYAIMALSQIDWADYQKQFSVSALCRKKHIKESYARKAFQLLSQNGILKAVTGPGGGYKFARQPDKISLYEIVIAVDGNDCFDKCVLGLPKCHDGAQCPMHSHWKPLKEKVKRLLKKITLGEIIRLDEKS
jgi:Rrf2 family protein